MEILSGPSTRGPSRFPPGGAGVEKPSLLAERCGRACLRLAAPHKALRATGNHGLLESIQLVRYAQREESVCFARLWRGGHHRSNSMRQC